MAFSATRKRLVNSYECVTQLEQQEEIYVDATPEPETVATEEEPEHQEPIEDEL